MGGHLDRESPDPKGGRGGAGDGASGSRRGRVPNKPADREPISRLEKEPPRPFNLTRPPSLRRKQIGPVFSGKIKYKTCCGSCFCTELVSHPNVTGTCVIGINNRSHAWERCVF